MPLRWSGAPSPLTPERSPVDNSPWYPTVPAIGAARVKSVADARIPGGPPIVLGESAPMPRILGLHALPPAAKAAASIP
jgi:hypothetical protein